MSIDNRALHPSISVLGKRACSAQRCNSSEYPNHRTACHRPADFSDEAGCTLCVKQPSEGVQDFGRELGAFEEALRNSQRNIVRFGGPGYPNADLSVCPIRHPSVFDGQLPDQHVGEFDRLIGSCVEQRKQRLVRERAGFNVHRSTLAYKEFLEPLKVVVRHRAVQPETKRLSQWRTDSRETSVAARDRQREQPRV
ncbi:MAG TPA: hypothetical protein VLU47_17200 [Blastocatellia bacterium]|nr:hypothetical protein [Blastocatellia bacterium]